MQKAVPKSTLPRATALRSGRQAALQLELPLSPPQPRSVPLAQAVGLRYAGEPIPTAELAPDNVIQAWQAQFLETMGYLEVWAR